MIPRVVITIHGAPAAEGRTLKLAGTEAEAQRQRDNGALVVGPNVFEVLAKVAEIFPGARVVELRQPGSPS